MCAKTRPMKYLLKYSPEMTTKSRVVRTRFCKQLRKNLARILKRQHGLVDRAAGATGQDAISVEAHWDYLEIAIPSRHDALLPRIEETLRWTPGICNFSRVFAYPLPELEEMLALVLEHYKERVRGRTFAVRCRRSGRQHPFSSMDVERFLGAGLLKEAGARGVNLDAPEVTVAVEIREQELFLVEHSRPGIGGFPLGTQDSVISLLSGGFDSAVASYLAMKRGLRTHFLFFSLGGRAHELAVKEVALYLWLKFGASHPVHFVTVPFEAVVAEILEKIENSQMGVILKRMMLRAANTVAAELDVEALVTGECVAQVSSQTLMNLAVIDEVSERLVLRPLAMADKQEIVDLARRIGTGEFSAVIPEYCGVISVKPTTRAKRPRIRREEANFDFTVLEQALAQRQQLDIRGMQQVGAEPAQRVPEFASPDASMVVIDIRHPDEEELAPLHLEGAEVLKIPFYRLDKSFAALPAGRQYLLYCAKGVMSRLHAAHLLEQGYNGIGVYHPGRT